MKLPLSEGSQSAWFLIAASLPATAMGLALCIQISALSWILSTKYDLKIHEIGIVWAAGPVAGIVGQLLTGLASDRLWIFGARRRPFILLAALASSLSLYSITRLREVGSALGTTDIVIVAAIVAFVLDLSINIGLNPARALVADVSRDRTHGFTWMQTISGGVGVCAYVFGAVFGNEILLTFGSVAVLLLAAATLFVDEKSGKVCEQRSGRSFESSVEWTEISKIMLAHAFTWFGVQSMFVYLFSFVQDKIMIFRTGGDGGMDGGQVVAIAFAVMNIVGFCLPALLISRLAVRFGRIKIHCMCVFTMALGYFGMGMFAHTPLALYCWMVLIGIGWGAVVSLPFAIIAEKVDKEQTGYLFGVFNLSVVLPQLASTQIGYLIQTSENFNLAAVCGCSLAISGVIWMLVREHPRQILHTGEALI